MKTIAVFLIEFYRKYLSPLKGGPCCRFYPTCSAYALEAFRTRGFFVGMWLSVTRILRCNPLFPGGYDPVPPRKQRTERRKKPKPEDVPPAKSSANED